MNAAIDQAGSERGAVAGGARRHIALVLAGLGAGGAERVASLIAGGWIAQGHLVTVIAFDREDEPVFHPFTAGIRMVRLGIEPRGPLAILRRVLALRRTLDRLDPDVTIAFLTKINVLTLLASLGTSRRVIVSERNNPRLQQANGIWNRLLALLQWRADAIVMQTLASVEGLAPAARRRAQVIPNPVARNPLTRLPHSGQVLAAVGRLTYQKGFDLLVGAFGQVADRHPDWRLVIWGEGPSRAALERQVEDAGLGARISLPGNSRTPAEWLGEADAFVLSSRYEGFSNALAEAMAAGLPVVAFDCDYSPAALIDPARSGLLVPGGDVGGLATALSHVMADAELRGSLGRAAREAMLRFDPQTIIARWERLIAQVAAPKPSGNGHSPDYALDGAQ